MGGGNREPKILDFTNSFNEDKTREYSDFCPTLRSERSGLCVQEPKIQIVGNTVPSNHEAGNVIHPNGISSTVMEKHGKGVQILDDYNSKIKYDGIACTLTQNCGAMARRNGQKVLEPDVESYKIRKLTPKECFKLQGVKESCIDLVVSDSQAYKIAGNAISVNVMQSLLRSLYKPVSKKDTLF